MKKTTQYKQKVDNKITAQDIRQVYQNGIIDWEVFRDKTFYITGATGVIGSFLIRCLRHANKYSELNIKLVLGVRDVQKALAYLKKEKSTPDYKLINQDINNPIKYSGKIDYIIHCASNTSSKSFVEKPVETFNTTVNGTKNILEFAKNKKVKGIVYLSSMEAYGDITEPKILKENELGNLDLQSVRSSYPLGKRAAEALCYNYAKEYDMPVKVVRLAQIIGANVNYNDSRVFAQFARSIVEKKDIILNTPARTTRSYCYITDLITALLTVLIKGNNGECYNISNENATVRICDMAESLTEVYSSSNLIFDIKEDTPYFKETHWVLDNTKIKNLGWKADVSIEEAYHRLISSFYYQRDLLLLTEKDNLGKKKRDYTKDTLPEQIFSIKNKGKYKVIKILGIAIPIDPHIFLKPYYKLPIQENKIVFSNFEGNGYGCNPKYIAEEILKRGLKYDLVWLAKQNTNTDDIPHQFRIVGFGTKAALKELITAKIWIDNSRKIFHLKKGLIKRPEQIYIQTWHGSLGIKKLDADVKKFNTMANEVWLHHAKHEGEMIDYLLTNSTFENNILPSALWINKAPIQVGHPRNDIFFRKNTAILQKVKQFYEIDNNKKVFLYIPSFRDDGDLSWYNIDYQMTLQALKERFGENWVFMVRQHPRVAKMKVDLVPQNKDIIDATFYPDIQELLVTADIAMSDYSSCIFDFMLSGKPAFIYATDIEKFNTDRGFYYSLESTPFPVATNNLELSKNIKTFNYEEYKTNVDNFLKNKGCMEDGHASQRVVDQIERVII